MEPLETDTLYLAATRPAMFMGVPLALGAILLMLAGFIEVLFKNPLYLFVMVPLWFAARELVARDYNAVGVVLLYLRTAGRSSSAPARHSATAAAARREAILSSKARTSAGSALPS